MSVLTRFIDACGEGDETEARAMYKKDPEVINQTDDYEIDRTGLIKSLVSKHYSITRWLLSLPGINTNFFTKNMSPLHVAC